MTVKLCTDSIRTMAVFENVTKVSARDCLMKEGEIYFVVDHDKIGLAIGRNGSKMKSLRRIFGDKHIKIFACEETLEGSIKSMIPTAKRIEIEGDSVVVSVPKQDKVSVIGKGGRNINAIREILKRRFAVKRLKLI